MTTIPPLPQQLLGPTGLRVTPIGLGCAPLGDMPSVFGYSAPADRELATLRAAFTGPLNFIDTAALYGDGEAERLCWLPWSSMPIRALLWMRYAADSAT